MAQWRKPGKRRAECKANAIGAARRGQLWTFFRCFPQTMGRVPDSLPSQNAPAVWSVMAGVGYSSLFSFSFRFPQCISLRSVNVRSKFRFNAFMTPMRANIAGPSFSATSNSACMAACHSSASCSAFGSSVMYSAASRKAISFLPLGNTIGSKNR